VKKKIEKLKILVPKILVYIHIKKVLSVLKIDFKLDRIWLSKSKSISEKFYM
jgi:hypothetical protein